MKKKVLISCVLAGTMLLSGACAAGGGASESGAEAGETAEATETEAAPIDMGYADVESIEDQIYTGSEITVSPVISYDGVELTEGSDYTLSYEGNVNIGTATVTATGNGDNTLGDITFTFNIITGNALCDEEENAGLVSFVDRLYVHLLGRYPTLDEMTDNVTRLRSGSRSGMEIVNLLVQSQEFEDRNLDEVAFVQAFYLGALGREADESGLWYNVNLLWDGMTRIDLINGIMDVPGGEFDNICNSLGIVLGYGHVTGAAPIINDGIPSSNFNYDVDGRTLTVHRRVYQFVSNSDDSDVRTFDLDAMCAASGYAPADGNDFEYTSGVCVLTLVDGAMTLTIGGDEVAYYEDTLDDGEETFRVNGTDTEVSVGMLVMIEYSLENVEQ